ncbi:MAG: PSD1 domain-containing protein [Planctomycetes bacterium]|nr:PSD1 domain-containing protein [Planctomycetota bacterium]
MHAIVTLCCAAIFGQSADAGEALFEAKIRPVLIDACFKCHGGEKISNGLKVDSRASLLKGGEHGPAIVPGEPHKSLLLRALRYEHDKIHMPPGKKLPDHLIDDFAAWIRQGAPWPEKLVLSAQPNKHWAFQPVRMQIPPVDPTGWAKEPIDRFLRARWNEKGLTPVGAADRATLLRRATFDLIGLPPTPEETAAFLKDDSPNAFAKVVDRLLVSPHYGERWGRHWMDVVRYADTAGDNADYPIPEIHRYRDYIIDAFKADKPFDQFVQEQLAGDIRAKDGPPEKSVERIVATGFLALSRRYATAPYEFWHLTLEDTIDTTAAAFLGLTMRCARCHDHKYDPITREDYYGLYAIFAATQFPYAGSEEFASMKKPREGFVPLVADAPERMAAYKTRLGDLAAEIKALEKEGSKERLKELKDEEKLWHRFGLPPDVPAAYAVSDGLPKATHIQVRGDPDRPGAIVPRRIPKFLDGLDPPSFPDKSSGRLELARWITRPDNPLTARVILNRIWQYHFGRGIVPTPNNFGLRGEPPTHPELLDYLAAKFIRQGWSIKKLHREIMLSKAYQLASTGHEANAARDPGNLSLWHFPRRRLDAEAIRDSLLAVSGTLDTRRPGPHPFPQIQDWKWTQHNPFKDVYPSNHRSVYLMTQRIQRHPFLGLFDGPDANASAERRTTSQVPLQALYFMNHPFVTEKAEQFARRIMKEAATNSQRIDRAFLLAYARPANKVEVERGESYLREYDRELRRSGVTTRATEIEAWISYTRGVLAANEFVFVD